MEINVNQTARTLLIGRNSTTRMGTLVLHQGDRCVLSVWLCDETGTVTSPLTVAAMGEDYTRISVAARALNALDGDLLFSATEFTEVGSGSTFHYEAELSLHTTQIDDLFDSATTKTAAALLDIELSNELGDKRLTLVGQWPTTIQRDIYTGDEVAPDDAVPPYPASTAIALKAPADGGYRIHGVNFQLWNPTQGKYQTVFITGAAGAETLAIGDEA